MLSTPSSAHRSALSLPCWFLWLLNPLRMPSSVAWALTFGWIGTLTLWWQWRSTPAYTDLHPCAGPHGLPKGFLGIYISFIIFGRVDVVSVVPVVALLGFFVLFFVPVISLYLICFIFFFRFWLSTHIDPCRRLSCTFLLWLFVMVEKRMAKHREEFVQRNEMDYKLSCRPVKLCFV